MSKIRLNWIQVKNYRSFWSEQNFIFPNEFYKKPIAIIGYNNAWKTNLMNSILYWIGEKFVSKETFSLNDFHNRSIENKPHILLWANSSTEDKYDWKKAILNGYHKLIIQTDWIEIEGAKIQSYNSLHSDWNELDDINWQAFGANKYFNIFYINFHHIKDEIQTQKTSWGNLKSFLAKHIKKIVDTDEEMSSKNEEYNNKIKEAKDFVLEGSKLSEFIMSIKYNYSKNLRDNNCEVEFGLPEYEDIFLQMIFKIGLNWNHDNLVPISHFWDWYISMFVMAVIQSIAESNINDRCLFLFEEPESFLHENHQEYFYKMVLCSLAEKWHQVIYTTHSDKMVDIFDTKSIVRLEFDDEQKQTIKKYNSVWEFSPDLDNQIETTDEPVTLEWYNQYIKSIEPNLNRILFSKKVILVEWPNDLMAYKFAIENYIKQLWKDEKYTETYLNFHNISIIPHHWKSTAILIAQLCRHLGIDYFLINDWDLEDDFINQLSTFTDISTLHSDEIYLSQLDSVKKWITTVNWKLINNSQPEKIHFNIPKLEKVLDWDSTTKNSFELWNLLQWKTTFWDDFFPETLINFLELRNIT